MTMVYSYGEIEADLRESIASLSGIGNFLNDNHIIIHGIKSSDFMSNGLLWNSLNFEVTYDDETTEFMTYRELKEVIKPYSKYKIDNIRVPVNMTLARFRVPFISNKNLGTWKNTKFQFDNNERTYSIKDIRLYLIMKTS